MPLACAVLAQFCHQVWILAYLRSHELPTGQPATDWCFGHSHVEFLLESLVSGTLFSCWQVFRSSVMARAFDMYTISAGVFAMWVATRELSAGSAAVEPAGPESSRALSAWQKQSRLLDRPLLGDSLANGALLRWTQFRMSCQANQKRCAVPACIVGVMFVTIYCLTQLQLFV